MSSPPTPLCLRKIQQSSRRRRRGVQIKYLKSPFHPSRKEETQKSRKKEKEKLFSGCTSVNRSHTTNPPSPLAIILTDESKIGESRRERGRYVCFPTF